MTQNVQLFWDKQANRYAEIEKQFASVYMDIIAKTSKYLDLDDNILDFGCATGTKTIEFADKVRQIHGLDISPEMIRNAMKKKDEAKIMNVSFSQGTLFSCDLEKSSFDKIIAYAIIHLLEDCEKVIQRIHELLKPGGLFISTTACMKDKMAVKTRLEVTTYLIMNKLGISPFHVNRFMPADVVKLIEDQGFQIVETGKITHEIPAVFIVARKT